MKSLIERDLTLQQVYRVLAARWHWVAAITFLGGLIALLLGLALPAEYRATASLGVGIDYDRSVPLSAEPERIALLQVQELLLADETLSAVVEELDGDVRERNGIEVAADLRHRLRIDRYEGRWDLSARAVQPYDSAQIANAWLEASVLSLQQSLKHAIRAGELQRAIYELGCELAVTGDGEQVGWHCKLGGEEAAESLSVELVEEIERSHGILPSLSFASLRQASPPSRPVYRGRSWMLLGGVMAGLALGIGLVLYGAPAAPRGPRADG